MKILDEIHRRIIDWREDRLSPTYSGDSEESGNSATKPHVLYAVNSYPQLSESYIAAEIDYVRARGVHVEVWSKKPPSTPTEPQVRVHRGSLGRAIARARPHLIHTHWTKAAVHYIQPVRDARLKMIVRGHWHNNPELFDQLQAESCVRRVFLFPWPLSQLDNSYDKFAPLPVSYNPDRYYPGEKDRQLVIRTVACKREKDLECFLKVAKLCPEHRFILVACRLGRNPYFNELVAANRRMGSPVDIRADLTYDEVSKLVRSAGIYLHTYGTTSPFGMPVSIAESMGTGSYILARQLPGVEEYIGDAGELYRDAMDAAHRIRATLDWSDTDWESTAGRSTARAEKFYRDDRVLETLINEWSAEVFP